MIDIIDYIKEYPNFDSLPAKLRKRVFAKTELDVVYTDLTNWERNDLLYLRSEEDKGSWKKLDYLEYTWVCIVNELLSFGFNYSEVRALKVQLFDGLTYQDLRAKILTFDSSQPSVKPFIDFVEFMDEMQAKGIMSDFNVPALEVIIAQIVGFGDVVSMCFFKDNELPFVAWSDLAIKGYEMSGIYDQIKQKLKESHLVVSISAIVSKFLLKGGLDSPEFNPYVLTKEEYTILKLIRKNYDNLKSINIKFAMDKMDRIEINTSKKVKVESRIIDHIKKGDYQKITIDTQDGKIVNFENTQKIKL